MGSPTAAVIASRGLSVLGIDTNEHVVKTVASGSIHIEEPDLEGLVQKVVTTGAMKVSTDLQPADVYIIAVPTPIKEDKSPDLSMIMAAVKTLTGVLRPGNLIILESTSPVGTTDQIAKQIAASRPELTIGGTSKESLSIAYCPERVLPGRILSELVNNDRCVGGVTPHCARRAQRFYKMFVRGACIPTDCAHRRDGEADRERVPRYQHRLRQRALADLRSPRRQRVGGDRPLQPPPACQRPAARTWRRWPLHRRRPLVHCRLGARSLPAHQDQPRGQRLQDLRRRSRAPSP